MNTPYITKEEFKAIRESLGETQVEFATRLGYKTKITVSYKENGQRTMSMRDAMILSQYIPRVRKAPAPKKVA